ncbi:MAG TPA: OmpA family protein [Stellaceae bacterium]|nr:OmpA family protein [Stellaceae bacterium]
MVAVAVGLSACSVPDWANPVEWYRDVSGASKDDPKSDARNTQNLQKGSEDEYPNLASVPPPPTNALSAADREKLRNSLAADRANAKYIEGNEQYVATPPQAVPSPPRNAPEPPAGGAAAPVEAAPVPPPAAAAAPQAAPRRSQPQAPPQESSLSAPSVRSLPQGETPRPPPPPPAGSPARAQQPAPQQTATLPPPYVPPAPPSQDPATDPAYASGGAAPPSGVGMTLGSVQFAGNSARLTPEMLAQVREAAALRQQTGGGTVRVTGYSMPQGEQDTMAPQLASFNLALDRARAVAAALTQNGVPARAVEISAAPPPPGQAGGVVEISLEQ